MDTYSRYFSQDKSKHFEFVQIISGRNIKNNIALKVQNWIKEKISKLDVVGSIIYDKKQLKIVCTFVMSYADYSVMSLDINAEQTGVLEISRLKPSDKDILLKDFKKADTFIV